MPPGDAAKEMTLDRMILSRLEEGGDAVRFLVPRNGKWDPMSCREALAAVREMAGGLMSLGLSKGDKVAILSSTRVEWTLADFAGILGGFVVVPIYPSNLPSQVEYILRHAGVRAAFVEDESQWNKVDGVRGNLPDLSSLILLSGDPAGKEGTIGIDGLRTAGAAYLSAHPGALEARSGQIRPEDELTIIYTSGTTGPPKGAVILHRNYAFNVRSVLQAVDVREGDVILHFLPFAHVLGRVEEFLAVGGKLVSAYARSLQTVAEDMPSVRPHIMVSVPRLYEKFYAAVRAKMDEEGGAKKALFTWALAVGREVSRRRQRGEPSGGWLGVKFGLADRLVFSKIRGRLGGRLRFFVSGGAPLSREIAEFFHAMGILILEGFGMTETPTVTSVNRLDAYRFGTVGKPIPGVEVRIAADGELLIRGPHVFKEYFRDPEATREAIDPEGWLHSGDIGELDKEGFLRITDRKKDMIATSGGKKVAPQNIENLLKTDPWVSQAFVYGDRRKYLTALLTLQAEELVKWAAQNGIPEKGISRLAKHPRVEEEMRARVEALNRTLAPFEQVKKFVLLGTDFTQETGELTPTMKVKRKVVLEKYAALLDGLYDRD
jgi:long-chain acyl-CoA synthetase